MNLQSVLARIFKMEEAKRICTYLHIGAYDGITDNPTYPLYLRGWTGICVEPLNDYFKIGVEERKRDRWIKGVVVEAGWQKPRTPFWVDPSGHFAGLQNLESLAEIYWRANHPGEPFPGMRKKSLKALKVNRDIPRGRFDKTGLDVLLIDVNGNEMDMLTTVDMALWKPHLVIVPDGWMTEAAMTDYMNVMGYYRLASNKIEGWLVYSNSLRDTHVL
jgi:hypothetical protein